MAGPAGQADLREQRSRLQASYNRFYSARDFSHYKQDIRYISFLAAMLPAAKGNRPRVLDVGCGTGYFGSLLQACNLDVYGVDISFVGLQKAVGNAAPVHLVQADASLLPFKAESFDMIFCQGFSLFNVPDLSSVHLVGSELVGILKDGGLFVFTWSSNLRRRLRKRGSWYEHSFEDVSTFVAGLGLEITGAYFIDRKIALRVLGKRVFNGPVSRVLQVCAKVSGLPGQIVCVGRKAAGQA